DNTTDPEKDPENDASNLLKVLRTFKEKDPTWFIADYCVDKHQCSKVLAQALMSDETTSSYI
ncbi:22171_t:CDS:2, partial [Gigaspora margarita]